MRRRIFLFALAFSLAPFFIHAEGEHSAVAPAPRPQPNWQKRHESFNERAKQGDVDLLFIGDSITQGWEGAGKAVWAERYASRKAMNLGIGGDRTQHVLWRLDNGNIEGLKPKAAVIMIGTNNFRDNSAREIADGQIAIVRKLRERLPEMKILLLAIFPRGEQAGNDDRKKLAEASKLAADEVADGKMVTALDIGDKFLQADGSLSKDIMPDFLHLSPAGYTIWADAIEPQVKAMLGEK